MGMIVTRIKSRSIDSRFPIVRLLRDKETVTHSWEGDSSQAHVRKREGLDRPIGCTTEPTLRLTWYERQVRKEAGVASWRGSWECLRMNESHWHAGKTVDFFLIGNSSGQCESCKWWTRLNIRLESGVCQRRVSEIGQTFTQRMTRRPIVAMRFPLSSLMEALIRAL